MIKTHPINSVLNNDERPIGSTFYDPKYGTLQVVEGGNTCEGCAYEDIKAGICTANTQNTGYCPKLFRSDKKNVIFKKKGKNND